jgi:hypothetical protein
MQSTVYLFALSLFHPALPLSFLSINVLLSREASNIMEDHDCLARGEMSQRDKESMGIVPACNRVTHTPTIEQCTLDAIRWIRLGTSEIRDCREWCMPDIGTALYTPPLVDRQRFMDTLGVDEDTIGELVIKMPAWPSPLPICNEYEMINSLLRVLDVLFRLPRLHCRNPGPVLVICTREEFKAFVKAGGGAGVVVRAQPPVVHVISSSPDENDGHGDGVHDDGPRKRRRVVMAEDPASPRTEGDSGGEGGSSPPPGAAPGAPIVIEIQSDDEGPAPQGTVTAEDIRQGMHEIISAALRESDLADSPESWRDACRLFGEAEDNFGDSTRPLPGFLQPLRFYQRMDVYKSLLNIDSEYASGSFNVSDVGFGKTIESLTVAGIIALAFLCRQDCLLFEGQHMHADGSGACQSRYRFGIECYCHPSSFARRIVRLPGGPSMVVCNGSIREQWFLAIENALSPAVVGLDGRTISDYPLLSAGGIQPPPPSSRGRQGLQGPEVEHFRGTWGDDGKVLMVKVPAASAKMVKAHPKYTLQEVHDTLQAVTPPPRPGPPRPHPSLEAEELGSHPSRFILVASRQALSYGSWEPFCERKIEIGWSGRQKPFTITVTGFFVPCLIIYDEWQEAASRTSKIINLLIAIARPYMNRRPLVTLLSASMLDVNRATLAGPLAIIDRGSLANRLAQFIDAERRHLKLHEHLLDPSISHDRRTRYEAELNSENLGRITSGVKAIFGRLAIFRRSGQSFLGAPGGIPGNGPPADIRPWAWADYGDDPAGLRAMISESRRVLAQSLRSDLCDGVTEGQARRLMMTREWRLACITSLVPAAARCSPDGWLVDGFRSVETEYLRSVPPWVSELECPQLAAAVGIAQGLLPVDDSADAAHAFLVTARPPVAAMVAMWLQHRIGSTHTIFLLTSSVTVDKRPAKLAKLAKDAADDRRRPIILVSTFALSAVGVDGLQQWVSRVIIFGSPSSTTDEHQAVGRVARSGSRFPVVIVHRLGGEEHVSQDWLSCQNVQGRMTALEMMRRSVRED